MGEEPAIVVDGLIQVDIAQEPCNYPKYYLGYLEILALQEEAEALWGDTYSDYSFHCFYLDNGPADFLSLEEQLTQWKP